MTAKKPSFAQALVRQPAWTRYSFALATAGCGIGIKLIVDQAFQLSLSPYLPAFASIMIAAALTGFGGGVVTTIVVTTWAFLSYPHLEHPAMPDTALRCCILFFEGLLLSAGFERMIRGIRKSTQSEQWHRKLIATASEGIWLVGSNSRIAFVNPRIASMLGYTPEEMQGADWEKFFFAEDLPMERIRFTNQRLGQVEQFDRRLKCKDGTTLWVLACVNSFTDETGDQGGFLAMMTDITERKKAELALRCSEARFRELFENVPEGVYQSTRDGRIIAANPMLLRMLGLDCEEDLNNPNIIQNFYVDPDSRARFLDLLETEGSFQSVELQLRHRDGRTIDVLENARTVRDEKGEVLYYEGTLIDITEKKRLEAKAAQDVREQAVRRFAHALAHDFNNVLTIISGHAELALSELPPAHPAAAHVRKVLLGYAEAHAVTNRLFTYLSARPVEGFAGQQDAPQAEAATSELLS